MQSGNYDPRPPEDRDPARATDADRTSRTGRRSRGTSKTKTSDDGIMRRLSGRSDLDLSLIHI